MRLHGKLLATLLCASYLPNNAYAQTPSIRVTDSNLSQFSVLNRTNRWTCYNGGSGGVLGMLSGGRVVSGATWSPLSTTTLRRMDLVVKSTTDSSSLTTQEKRELRRISRYEKDRLLLLSSTKSRCESGSTTPTPQPTRTAVPTSTRTAVPTVQPTRTAVPTATIQPTRTPVPTATAQPTATVRPTSTSTPRPSPTAVPTHNHGTETPQALPRLAASNNRAGTYGITTPSISNVNFTPRTTGTRDTFRSRVPWTHIAYDDPIVYPGQPGRSHLHMFFGNALVDANTTPDNIRSRCRSGAAGGTANCSGYWIPALLNGAGEVMAPDFTVFYYKAGYQVMTNDGVVPPQGLAMITGNMNGSPTNNVNDAQYHWSCHDTGVESRGIPDCPAGGILSVSIEFPTCWNGQDMGWSSPSDHKSHMKRGENGRCPTSHPIQIPDITLNAEWRVPAGGTTGFRLSSDMYQVSNAARGGYSMHADWIMGWDPAVMQRIVDNCNNRQVDCVVDNLGDGGYLNQNHQVGMYR